MLTPRLTTLLRGLPAVLWAGVILWLSLSPSPPQPPQWLGWDKLQHAAAYALLVWLLGYAWSPRPTWRNWLPAIALASGYGVLMELLQGSLTSYRDPSLGDALANLAGTLLGAGLAICRASMLRHHGRSS